MTTVLLIACIGMIAGAFILLRLSPMDFTAAVFARLTDKPKSLRDEINETTHRRKRSYLRRQLAEAQAVLEATGRGKSFPMLCAVSLAFFAAGASVAIVLGNPFLVPVMASGLMLLPFWYTVSNIYYPAGDSQLAWVNWKTPDTGQDIVIHVTVYGPGSTAKATINVKIVDLDRNPPPNPVADDRNDSFTAAAVPSRPVQASASWTVWRPWWHANWVWYSTGEDGGYWVDEGWWEFDLDRYNASLTAAMSITCDSKNPTASGRTMKSGYGINQTVTGSTSSNQSSAVTQPQNAVSYFPEFGYATYWRLLDRMGSGRFEFQKNPYSTYKGRTHFTPIWMPDGAYTVNTWLIDAWTPAGMLSANLTDSLTIRGNLWQDWHIAPLKP